MKTTIIQSQIKTKWLQSGPAQCLKKKNASSNKNIFKNLSLTAVTTEMEISSLWKKQLLSSIFGKGVLKSNPLSIKVDTVAVWPQHRAARCLHQPHSSCDGGGGLPAPGSQPMGMGGRDRAPFLCLTPWWGTSSLSLLCHTPKNNQM